MGAEGELSLDGAEDCCILNEIDGVPELTLGANCNGCVMDWFCWLGVAGCGAAASICCVLFTPELIGRL